MTCYLENTEKYKAEISLVVRERNSVLLEFNRSICTMMFAGVGGLELPECFVSILSLLALGY